MNTRAGLFALSCLVPLLAPCGARAADAPHYSFSCDAPAGNRSDWTRSLSAARVEIAGKFQVGELYEHKKWRPAASVLLRPSSEKGNRFGFRILGDDSRTKLLSVDMFKVGGHETLFSLSRSAKWVPFKLTLLADGTIETQVGDAKSSVRVPDFKAMSFELACTTASFEFADVTVVEKD